MDANSPAVAWMVSRELVAYDTACDFMAKRVDAVAAGHAPELIWLLEHPPLYTAGTSAKSDDLLEPGRLPVFRTGRGGQFTYHGPGQRVIYVILDVKQRFGDVRAYVAMLERLVIEVLAGLGVTGEQREGRIGVWVHRAARKDYAKIAAIGVRLRRWVSSHGISLNVAPDLAHFSGIVPCGLNEPVTSLADLGLDIPLEDVDVILRAVFERYFGPMQAVRGLDTEA